MRSPGRGRDRIEGWYIDPALRAEIEENDHNLNITRYVDTFEEEAEVDIEANLKEMAEIDDELVVLEKEMVGYLRELGIVNDE